MILAWLERLWGRHRGWSCWHTGHCSKRGQGHRDHSKSNNQMSTKKSHTMVQGSKFRLLATWEGFLTLMKLTFYRREEITLVFYLVTFKCQWGLLYRPYLEAVVTGCTSTDGRVGDTIPRSWSVPGAAIREPGAALGAWATPSTSHTISWGPAFSPHTQLGRN